MRRVSIILLSFLLTAGAVIGQERDAADSVPRRVLLFVSQAAGAGYDADELVLVARSLLLRLQAGVKGVILVDPGPGAAPATDEDRFAATESAGADCWLSVELEGDAASTRLRVRSYDVFYRTATIDSVVTREGRLSVLSLPEESWEDVAGLVGGAYPPLTVGSMPAAGSTTAMLTIRALPGTRIAITGGGEVTAGPDGTAALSVTAPGVYELRASLSGYSPVSRDVYVTADREVDIPQVTGARFALDVSLVDLGYPGLGVSLFISPDTFFLRLSATTYALGLALNETDVFTSNPLTNVILQAGLALAPADRAFRPYLAFGGFVRLVHAAPAYMGLDPISPAGVQIAIGAELSRNPRARFFLEYVPAVYMTRVPLLMRASLGSEKPPPGWHFSEGTAQQLLTIRLGYRWML